MRSRQGSRRTQESQRWARSWGRLKVHHQLIVIAVFRQGAPLTPVSPGGHRIRVRAVGELGVVLMIVDDEASEGALRRRFETDVAEPAVHALLGDAC